MSNDDDNLRLKCAKRGCGWSGLERDLKLAPQVKDDTGATKQVCPQCSNDSYYILESVAMSRWEEERRVAKAQQSPMDAALREVLDAGNVLANICYNLAQRGFAAQRGDGPPLTFADKELLDKARQRWDVARNQHGRLKLLGGEG